MGTLAVQLASPGVLYCYAIGVEFSSTLPAGLHEIEGVCGAHLVTIGRERTKWCLVVPIKRRTRPSTLLEIVEKVKEVLGFDNLEFWTPLTSPQSRKPIPDICKDLDQWLDV